MDCTAEQICQAMACMKEDIDTLWKKVFGREEKRYIFITATGIPSNVAYGNSITDDRREYTYGAALINQLDPDGLFLLGDANFDDGTRPDFAGYDLINQETKVTAGFANFLIQKKLWPVMGDMDWLPAGPSIANIERTYLRMFNYLPNARYYYSVVDEKTSTEFFVLSSSFYRDPYDTTYAGYTIPGLATIGSDMHTWFMARAAASGATNKIVIFHNPFISITDILGVPFTVQQFGQGNASVFPDFRDWDFGSVGVKLIINGHSAFPMHFQKQGIHIVTPSGFSRSRYMLRQVASTTVEPPVVNTIYGQQGWALQYFSHIPMSVANAVTPPRNVFRPAGIPVAVPRAEFIQVVPSLEGMTVQFVSYDPYAGSIETVIATQKVEHSFTIDA